MIPALIPLILGQVAQKVAPKILEAAVESLVQAPDVPVSQENAPAVRDTLSPLIRKITGAGKYAILFGGIGTLCSGFGGLFMALGNAEGDPEIYITSLTGIASGVSIIVGWTKARQAAK